MEHSHKNFTFVWGRAVNHKTKNIIKIEINLRDYGEHNNLFEIATYKIIRKIKQSLAGNIIK